MRSLAITISCVSLASALPARMSAGMDANAAARVAEVEAEHQPIADQGNGSYRNPILPGNFHDPSVVRVGADYYMVHCPGLIVWHSRDLVNWAPIGRVQTGITGDIWAPDLSYFRGLFYLYLPVRISTPGRPLEFTNVVLTAKNPAGAWSKPVNLHIGGIDPAAVVDRDGKRYLYTNDGRVVQLTADGLATVGKPHSVYRGWPIPEDWIVECQCLESPKLVRHGGWFYLISAEGGTAGPSTSHMVVVARAHSAIGPWENSPYNPMLRTWSRAEPWWSQGHGTLIDTPSGSWWMVFHGVARNHRSLGRETLLLPVDWTPDGWPIVRRGVGTASVIAKPEGENVGPGMPLSDEFASSQPGWQWSGNLHRARFGAGRLVLSATGSTPDNAAEISVAPVNKSYEVQVEVDTAPGVEAGLLITGALGPNGYTGVCRRAGGLASYIRGKGERGYTDVPGTHAWLRILNVDQDVALYYRTTDRVWKKLPWGCDVSGNGILRVALYASGKGAATFRHFRYRGLETPRVEP